MSEIEIIALRGPGCKGGHAIQIFNSDKMLRNNINKNTTFNA